MSIGSKRGFAQQQLHPPTVILTERAYVAETKDVPIRLWRQTSRTARHGPCEITASHLSGIARAVKVDGMPRELALNSSRNARGRGRLRGAKP